MLPAYAHFFDHSAKTSNKMATQCPHARLFFGGAEFFRRFEQGDKQCADHVAGANGPRSDAVDAGVRA
jgi:hypothetical protein